MEPSAPTQDTSQVSRAQGLVSTQVDCSVDEALRLLNERAKATGLRLEEVAVAVVSRRTSFH